MGAAGSASRLKSLMTSLRQMKTTTSTLPTGIGVTPFLLVKKGVHNVECIQYKLA